MRFLIHIPGRGISKNEPQILVHAITFEQIFRFLSFWHIFGPWPIDYLIIFGRFSSWPWHWIFEVKNGICYISAKNGSIATKQQVNTSIELYASNVTIGFDFDHDFDLEFSKSNMEFAISEQKNGPIATKWKANIFIDLKASNVSTGFDLGHDLDR